MQSLALILPWWVPYIYRKHPSSSSLLQSLYCNSFILAMELQLGIPAKLPNVYFSLTFSHLSFHIVYVLYFFSSKTLPPLWLHSVSHDWENFTAILSPNVKTMVLCKDNSYPCQASHEVWRCVIILQCTVSTQICVPTWFKSYCH